MSKNSLSEILKLSDIVSINNEIKRSMFMIVFFGSITAILNYVKTHSLLYLISIGLIVLGMVISGIIATTKIKKDRRIFLLFEACSLLAVSIFFVGICFTSYYTYLGYSNNLFACILIILDVVIAVLTYMIYKKILTSGSTIKRGKAFGGSILSLGAIGYIIGWVLSKRLGQVDIYIALIVLAFFVSSVCIMASAINLLKFKLMHKIGIR